MHQAAPFAVAEEGDDCVEGIKDAIERDAFIPIQAGADSIYQYPGYPLLEVFAGQHPHAYYAQRSGEGIRDGDRAVGKIVEY